MLFSKFFSYLYLKIEQYKVFTGRHLVLQNYSHLGKFVKISTHGHFSISGITFYIKEVHPTKYRVCENITDFAFHYL